MTAGVYCIENVRNGKKYIGSAKDPKTRWRGHVADLRLILHSNTNLQAAWIKFGEDAFRFSVIEEVNGGNEILRLREQYWIDEYSQTTILYNVATVVRKTVKKRNRITLSFSFDAEADADIIRWLNRQTNRSSTIRQILRDRIYQEVTLTDVYQAVKELGHRLRDGAVLVAPSSVSLDEWDEPPEAAAALDGLGL